MHFVAIFVSHLFSRQTPVLIYTQGYIYFTHIYVIYIFGNELERILDLFEGVFICFCFFFYRFKSKEGIKRKKMSSMNVLYRSLYLFGLIIVTTTMTTATTNTLRAKLS